MRLAGQWIVNCEFRDKRNGDGAIRWQSAGYVFIIPLNMANLYYSDRLIIAFASLNQSDKQWTAGAEITWKRDGERQSHSIGGLADRFKTSDDAEKFVIHLAKAWIDSNP